MGAGLLFWGVTTGNLIVAVLLAVVLEARLWMKVRWDFDENAQVKAFQLSLLLMALWVALSWIEDEGRQGSLNVIRWMPLIAFPIEFVQRYGKLDRMNLNAFFYFSRRRMQLDIKEGKEVDPIQVNTGYLYMIGVLAAAATEEEVAFYWPVLWAFVVLVLFSVQVQRGLKWTKALWVLPFVVALSWGIQWSMSTVYAWAKARLELGMSSHGPGFLVDWTSHLSEPGKVKLNPKIEWRVWSEKAPHYLRVASFNHYNSAGRWTYNFKAGGFDSIDDSYDSVGTQVFGERQDAMTYFRPEDKTWIAKEREAQSLVIRGTVDNEEASSVVPVVDGFYGVSNMLGRDVFAEVSAMGAMRLVNRERLLDYKLWVNPECRAQDSEPDRVFDLKPAVGDEAVVSLLAKQLKLSELQSEEEVVDTVMRYFRNQFEYSTDFDHGGNVEDRSKLAWFLTDLKKGHCEYFATATTLLLREVGIPARYCVGYSGVEKGRGCWNVRGTNAHAWTRAYIGGQWIDVDATPPDWRGVTEGQKLDPVEWLREQISLLREDFFMWRQDPENRNTLIFRGGILAALLLLWIVFRLWRARSKASTATAAYLGSWDGEVIKSPLLELEKLAKKHLGERKNGEPLGAWIQQLVALDGMDDELVMRAVANHQSLRFDSAGDAAELNAMVRELKKQLRTL